MYCIYIQISKPKLKSLFSDVGRIAKSFLRDSSALNGLIRHRISEWMPRCIHLFCAFCYRYQRRHEVWRAICEELLAARVLQYYTEHMHQEIMRALSIYASGTYACTEQRSLQTRCAYASETDAYTDHIRIRNLCEHWAYISGTYAVTEHTHQELARARALSKGPIKHAEHIHQELTRALSIRIRNWCVH